MAVAPRAAAVVAVAPQVAEPQAQLDLLAALKAAAVRPDLWAAVARLVEPELMLAAWPGAALPVVAALKVVDPQAAAVPKVAALRAAVAPRAGPALKVAVPRVVPVVSRRPEAELPVVAARKAAVRKAAVRKVVVVAAVA